MITQEDLKKLIKYNPETGVCQWVHWRKGYGQIGTYDKSGYLVLCIRGKQYKLHRLIWLYVTGEFPTNQVDHINQISSDNRWCNLREASNSQNNCNKVVQSNSKTGVKGICRYLSYDGRYFMLKAQLQFEGKSFSKSISLNKRVESEGIAILTTWLETKCLELHKEFTNHG